MKNMDAITGPGLNISKMMIDGFRKPIEEVNDPYFYICGGRYTLTEIENMPFNEFCYRRNASVPKKIYKYFSNIETIIDSENINYSHRALKNGTVYLQNIQYFDDNYDSLLSVNYEEYVKARLVTYAALFGIDYEINANASDIADELSVFLYNQLKNGKSIEDIVALANSDATSEISMLSHEVFLRKLFVYVMEVGKPERWQIAFNRILNEEYENVVNYSKQFRIACFSESPYLVDMWSRQYANNHQGFCIEYQLPEKPDVKEKQLLYNFFPVIYSDNRKDLLNACMWQQENKIDEKHLAEIYKFGLLAKSKSLWMQQKEWRLISPGNMLADDYECPFFAISKVYLGQKMKPEARKDIINICEEKGIPYVGVKPMSYDYEMMDCPGNCKVCINNREQKC